MTVTYSVTRLLGGGNGSHTQKVYLYPAFVPSSHTPRPLPLQPGESVNKPRILASGSFLRSCVCWELSLGQAGGETLGIQLWCPCLPPPSWADRVLRIWISRHPPPAPHPRSLARWKGRMGQWLRTQTLQLDDFFFFFAAR